ncbi:hypothetical protein BDZ97DRAFT_1761161 [Flammula alnicola]|nr:hypothetical protein BDZ97DRAFT_1761161 [Flammula alnicola]
MSGLLSHHELERRLLRWIGSSFVPRYPFFEGPFTAGNKSTAQNNLASSGSLQDLNRWYNDIELASNDCEVPVEQYPDTEVYLKQTKRVFWDWKDFKEDLRRIVDEAAKIITSPQVSNLASDAMEQLRRAHPYIASSVKMGLMVGGTAVLLPALGLMAWNRLRASQPAVVDTFPH